MKNNFEVLTDRKFEVRDLEPGDYYIIIRDVRRYGSKPEILWRYMRVRDEDPFFAQTVLGTTVHSYPSDKCYKVRSLEDANVDS